MENYPNYLWEEISRSIRDMTTYLILSGGYHALLLTQLLLSPLQSHLGEKEREYLLCNPVNP